MSAFVVIIFMQWLEDLVKLLTHVYLFGHFNTYTARPVCWREWIS